MLQRPFVATVVVMLLGLMAPGAAGAPPTRPRIQVRVDPCLPIDEPELRRVVTLELRVAWLEAGETPGRATTRVTVSCQKGLVSLRVLDPLTGKTLERTVDLLGAPASARSRLLALAIVELVGASWSELELSPRPAVPPAAPTASPAVRRAAIAALQERRPLGRRSGLRLLAVASGATYFRNTPFLGGAGLRVAHDLSRGLGWSVDLLGHHGSSSTALGSVAVDTLSGGPALAYHRRWAWLGLRIGGGFRIGAAHLSGQPIDGETTASGSGWGVWGGPFAGLSVAASIGRALVVELSTEGGYVVLPVHGRVDGVKEVSVAGPWLGFQLGVGVFLL